MTPERLAQLYAVATAEDWSPPQREDIADLLAELGKFQHRVWQLELAPDAEHPFDAREIADAFRRSRRAFPDSTRLEQIPTLLAVIAGDVARHARAAAEGQPVDLDDVLRELGNLALSSLRWIEDLGSSAAAALDAAASSQEAYAARARVAPIQPNGDPE